LPGRSAYKSVTRYIGVNAGGILTEASELARQKGSRSGGASPSPGKPYTVALDIGGTKMLAVALDRKFKPLGRARKRTLPKSGPITGQAIFKRIVEVIGSAITNAGQDAANLLGVGVGSPGPLDPNTGIIIDTPNLQWKDFPLAEKISKAFGRVPVALDNDVNLGTYGEYHFGAARGGRHVVGVFPGTGIGGAVIIDGKLLHGASGAAGEVGHMIYDPNGPLCGCGARGCIEAFAGRNWIAGEVIRGKAPALAASAGTDIRKIRSGQIASAIKAGDQEVERVLREKAHRIGVTVASVVNLLSPDRVVLGGGLVEAMPRLFVQEVEGAIKQFSLPFLAKFVKVLPAALGDDATVMGAAMLIAERVGRDEKKKD